ncbi:MAG: glycerate kinase [Nitrososphaerota archaeon]
MNSIIKNVDELVERFSGSEELIHIMIKCITKAIENVRPASALSRYLRLKDKTLVIDDYFFELKKSGRVFLIAVGKASLEMSQYVINMLGQLIDKGIVIYPQGMKKILSDNPNIEFVESTHPIPSEKGLKAASKIVELSKNLKQDDLVIFLLSGGASALLPLPYEGITLEDKIETTKVLLKAGATIHEINTIRKHISAIKGGRLAEMLQPATVVSLIISDVPGDNLEVIGSGPTVPDPTSFKDAYDILLRRNIMDKIPPNVIKLIEMGINGSVKDTPKPGSPVFQKVKNIIVARVRDACYAAIEHARKYGYDTLMLSDEIEGEASSVGTVLGSLARYHHRKKKLLIIGGGETTVKVKGSGIGGRNQEVALAASVKIAGLKDVLMSSIGTDGIDGPTDAAGAIVDGQTYELGVLNKMYPEEYLRNNDSYTYFKKIGGLIFTGYTGTNVGDILLILTKNS